MTEIVDKFDIHSLFDQPTFGADWGDDLKDQLKDALEYWSEWLDGAWRAGFNPHATIDFEARSACDLRKHGSWQYSKHPTTEAMVLRYKLPDAGPDDRIREFIPKDHRLGGRVFGILPRSVLPQVAGLSLIHI